MHTKHSIITLHHYHVTYLVCSMLIPFLYTVQFHTCIQLHVKVSSFCFSAVFSLLFVYLQQFQLKPLVSVCIVWTSQKRASLCFYSPKSRYTIHYFPLRLNMVFFSFQKTLIRTPNTNFPIYRCYCLTGFSEHRTWFSFLIRNSNWKIQLKLCDQVRYIDYDTWK